SAARMAERLEMQREQWRLDRQELAGLEGGLARSLQPAVYAEDEADTLATLLPGGETAFPPLSVALWRDYRAAAYGTAQPDLGSAYVKSVSSDGEGGFRVVFVIDGRESSSHFPVHLFSADNFSGSAEDNALVPYLLWSWTDSFEADVDEPAATTRTTGSSLYDYFDINGWQAGGALIGNFRGFMTYGATTRAENLPTGSATYEGRLDAEIWRADSWEWGSRSSLRGTIYLEADFAAGKIGGKIDALRVQHRAADAFQPLPEGNVIDIASVPIDEARITAQWVGNDTNANAPPHETIDGFAGTLIGEFYGPRADEAGGALSGRRASTAATPEQFLLGAFGASRPDPGD
ncbi:MAG: transferrin-binding protein-like solute binding protein, partial [Candidatus Tectomicrobia bacterium]|nr:transferrin-binding protein-like solute binding protein [Candidatus Tectomicrobia bacterium]